MAIHESKVQLTIRWDDQRTPDANGFKQTHPADWDFHKLLDLSPEESVHVEEVLSVTSREA